MPTISLTFEQKCGKNSILSHFWAKKWRKKVYLQNLRWCSHFTSILQIVKLGWKKKKRTLGRKVIMLKNTKKTTSRRIDWFDEMIRFAMLMMLWSRCLTYFLDDFCYLLLSRFKRKHDRHIFLKRESIRKRESSSLISHRDASFLDTCAVYNNFFSRIRKSFYLFFLSVEWIIAQSYVRSNTEIY